MKHGANIFAKLGLRPSQQDKSPRPRGRALPAGLRWQGRRARTRQYSSMSDDLKRRFAASTARSWRAGTPPTRRGLPRHSPRTAKSSGLTAVKSSVATRFLSRWPRYSPTTPLVLYVGIVRQVRPLGRDAALLRAVSGVVPAGADDLDPALNAIQSLVRAARRRWLAGLFSIRTRRPSSTGAPKLAEALTRDLPCGAEGGPSRKPP